MFAQDFLHKFNKIRVDDLQGREDLINLILEATEGHSKRSNIEQLIKKYRTFTSDLDFYSMIGFLAGQIYMGLEVERD